MKHDYQTSVTLVALFCTLAALLTIATASAHEADVQHCIQAVALLNK